MPPMTRLTAEALEADGLYLLDTGYLLLLWIGKQVHPQALQDLLNLPSVDRLDGAKVRECARICTCGVYVLRHYYTDART